jgi:hypothetical protein
MSERWAATAGLVATALMVGGGIAGHPADAQPKPGQKPAKITICHRTNSDRNPYVQITVSTSSTGKHGHEGHTGPVYRPGMKPDHQKWGDIIPPHDLQGGPVAPMNWTAAGQSIWSAGCHVPQPVATTTTVTPTSTPAAPTPGSPGTGSTGTGSTGTGSTGSSGADQTEVHGESVNRAPSAAPAKVEGTEAAQAQAATAVPASTAFTG